MNSHGPVFSALSCCWKRFLARRRQLGLPGAAPTHTGENEIKRRSLNIASPSGRCCNRCSLTANLTLSQTKHTLSSLFVRSSSATDAHSVLGFLFKRPFESLASFSLYRKEDIPLFCRLKVSRSHTIMQIYTPWFRQKGAPPLKLCCFC